MIYIHGGVYVTGDSTDLLFGPDFLLTQDNILVTVQYRLGMFGFLNLGHGDYTGNMGLKDQQLAIKWIYENIDAFSGNRNEILLMGESAGRSYQRKELLSFSFLNFELLSIGGSSVNFHILNEESRKYFNRAYLSSGTAFTYFALSTGDHLVRMQEFSKINETNDLIEYLKTVDSMTLANCHTMDSIEYRLSSPWAPTIENSKAHGAFLTRIPDEIYNSANAPAMDTLFSFNSQVF